MKMHWARLGVFLIGIFVFSTDLIASAISTASTADSSLVAIASAAQAVGALNNDRGSYMKNYIKYHIAPAATRLSQVCNMTTNSFSGNEADQGVILGMTNNTGVTFIIQQGGQNIGQLTPGWNGNVVLNLASLSSSSSTTASLPSFTFIPSTGVATSKLVVRVMTGQQLFTHIAAEQTKETVSAAVTFLKNGANPLPGAGEVAAIASDMYLVVENQSITSSKPLSAAAKRIQVLNLSNLTNLYTLSLSIGSMGLASINNQVSQQSTLSSDYAISIQSVHILNEVVGHTVPLLLMSRPVYLAESGVNSLYAAYMQKYAKAVGGAHAGAASVYYDLSMTYTHEPFEYLRILKYFDLYRSLLAVVDQNGVMPSGQVIGSCILTDVYGAYIQNVSSDISWVSCNSAGFDSANDDQILFACATTSDVKPSPGSGVIKNWLQQSLQSLTPAQPTIDLSTHGTSGFPISKSSSAMMFALTISAGNYYGCINVHVNAAASEIAGVVLNTGTPTSVNPGQSYNNVGSMPSGWWTLGQDDLINGVKVVPVFYKAGTCVPFLSNADYQLVNSTNLSALYYYSYNSITGQPLGLLPVLAGNLTVGVYSEVSTNAWWGQCKGGQIISYWSAEYAAGGAAKPGDSNLVSMLASYVDYPGYSYLASLPTDSAYLYTVRNKFVNMLPLRDLIQKHWDVSNAVTGVCALSIPVTDIQLTAQNADNGIVVQLEKTTANNYELVVFDAHKNVLGFQQIFASDDAMDLIACRLSSQGTVVMESKPLKLPETIGYFKLSHIPGVGLQLVPTTVVAVAKKTVAPVTVTSAAGPQLTKSTSVGGGSRNGEEVQVLTAENAKLRAENKKLRNELAAVNNG